MAINLPAPSIQAPSFRLQPTVEAAKLETYCPPSPKPRKEGNLHKSSYC